MDSESRMFLFGRRRLRFRDPDRSLGEGGAGGGAPRAECDPASSSATPSSILPVGGRGLIGDWWLAFSVRLVVLTQAALSLLFLHGAAGLGRDGRRPAGWKSRAGWGAGQAGWAGLAVAADLRDLAVFYFWQCRLSLNHVLITILACKCKQMFYVPRYVATIDWPAVLRQCQLSIICGLPYGEMCALLCNSYECCCCIMLCIYFDSSFLYNYACSTLSCRNKNIWVKIDQIHLQCSHNIFN